MNALDRAQQHKKGYRLSINEARRANEACRPLKVGRHEPGKSFSDPKLTLGADEDAGDLGSVAELRHFRVVVVHGAEARLAVQAEHEDHRVDPRSELSNGHRKKTELNLTSKFSNIMTLDGWKLNVKKSHTIRLLFF